MEREEGNYLFSLTNTLYQEIEAIKSVNDIPSEMNKNLEKREIERERERERERINTSQVDISNITTTTMIHTFRTYFVFPHTIYFV